MTMMRLNAHRIKARRRHHYRIEPPDDKVARRLRIEVLQED
jgi:hypothetical protein